MKVGIEFHSQRGERKKCSIFFFCSRQEWKTWLIFAPVFIKTITVLLLTEFWQIPELVWHDFNPSTPLKRPPQIKSWFGLNPSLYPTPVSQKWRKHKINFFWTCHSDRSRLFSNRSFKSNFLLFSLQWNNKNQFVVCQATRRSI